MFMFAEIDDNSCLKVKTEDVWLRFGCLKCYGCNESFIYLLICNFSFLLDTQIIHYHTPNFFFLHAVNSMHIVILFLIISTLFLCMHCNALHMHTIYYCC